MEETRIAIVAVIVEDFGSAMEVNETLHQFGSLIVGRMGLPYRDRGLHVIALILDGEGERTMNLRQEEFEELNAQEEE